MVVKNEIGSPAMTTPPLYKNIAVASTFSPRFLQVLSEAKQIRDRFGEMKAAPRHERDRDPLRGRFDKRVTVSVGEATATIEQGSINVDGEKTDHQNSRRIPTEGMRGIMFSYRPVASNVRRFTDGSAALRFERL